MRQRKMIKTDDELIRIEALRKLVELRLARWKWKKMMEDKLFIEEDDRG